jgi:hypothetical protein
MLTHKNSSQKSIVGMTQVGCPEFEPQSSGNKKKSLEDCAIDL